MSSDKAEYPVGKRNGLGIMDIDEQLLVNGGEVRVGGTMINVAVTEQHVLL